MHTNDVVMQNSWRATKAGQVKHILKEEVTQWRYKLSTQKYVNKFFKTSLFKKYVLDKYYISFLIQKVMDWAFTFHIKVAIPYLLLCKGETNQSLFLPTENFSLS